MSGFPSKASRWVRSADGARVGIRAVVALVVSLAALVGMPASALAATGEHIVSFTADYALQADGGMAVTETLVWDFGTSGTHHGIKRYVTTRQGYDKDPSKHREYQLSAVSVSSPSGAPADQDVSQVGADTVIRVGNPNRTVGGTQTYVLRYHLAHVVNGFADHVELYWNVTGDQTAVPTDAVHVTVRGPATVTKAACFYGARGATTTCQASPGKPARFEATGLAAYQQVSIVASLPVSAFSDVAPDLREGGSDSGAFDPQQSTLSPGAAKAVSLLSVGGGIGVPALAALLMGYLVRTRGRDEQYAGLTPGLEPAAGAETAVVRGRATPVAVQFQPPKDVRPGLMGTVLDEEANTIDVSATVVDLAVRGFLRIEELETGGLGGRFTRKDWELTALVPPAGEALLPYEQVVLNGLFATSNPVQLSALKNRFHTTLSEAKSEMYAEVVRRGWFRTSPEQQRARWTGLGLGLIVLGVASGWLLGLNSSRIDSRAGLSIGIPSGVVLAAGLVVAGLLVRTLGRRMPARTASGSAVLAQSLGFKQYLVTAEARQIAFEEAQDIFSRYLPYAIVFGVADGWAKVFAEVAAAAAAAGTTLATPGWYVFAGAGGFGSFGGIADGVDSFSTTAAGTFTSTPGSSGSSGFGGGGFSGGGGGGGGSGSW